MIRTLAAALATGTCIVALATPAAAQTREYNIPVGSLKSALDAYVRQSGRQVVYRADQVRSARSPGIRGQQSAEAALAAILAGSGFTTRVDGNLVAIVRGGNAQVADSAPPMAAAGMTSAENDEILVTGSRIRGAPSTSSVTMITRDEAQRAGQTDLGQIIRDLPQNFSGGANPTIAGPGQGGTQNGNGSSALNLRGLGPDASLTLINGHRIAYDAIYQGVDISAIPLAAIERIDVVADGASALYGSDAVGGVANVILRRRIDAVVTSVKFGASTSGGGETQQYSIAGGPSWTSGSLMLASEFRKSTEIAGRDRSYTNAVAPDATMIAGQKQFSFVLAGEQRIGDTISLEIDGHFMHRSVPQCLTGSVAAPQLCRENGSVVVADVDSWSVSPAFRIDLSGGWKTKFGGTYSETESDVLTRVISNRAEVQLVRPNYVNKLKAIEAGAEGPLFSLPGGDARFAFGGGYREDTLDVDTRSIASGVARQTVLFSKTRKIGFAYGELFLPLISPSNGVSLIEKFQIVGALRYENHRGVGAVTTPKIGAVVAITPSLEFKGSWGKSFKVPTLFQTGQLSNAQLVPSNRYTPAPPNNLPVLYTFGGNPNLDPERATTWTISSSYSPPFFDGLRAELSYFRIQYRDRVAAPVSSTSGALLPVYADFVRLNPSSQEVLDALAGVTGTFTNLTTGPFDPAAISAIFRNNLQNVSLQSLEGVDISVRYIKDFANKGRLTLNGTATYIDSNRRLTNALPLLPQSGVIFTPAHWRGRITTAWEIDNVVVTAIGNYFGGTVDNRLVPNVNIGSFKTLDAVTTIRSKASTGLLANLEWRIGIQNLFNEKPDLIRSTFPSQPPYDSLNQSPLGRVVSLSLTKVW